ncbi:hypothetical protein ACFRQM_12870 [Streptomyces sp. NPDC056831]|uniref:hypothetical protein n=1 Tax=Streptomyces sp. NPDC056831 TaxID=3345954 RepID=UPI0036CF77B5
MEVKKTRPVLPRRTAVRRVRTCAPCATPVVTQDIDSSPASAGAPSGFTDLYVTVAPPLLPDVERPSAQASTVARTSATVCWAPSPS